MVDLSGTFDTTNALSGMFLWLTFGYLSVLLNCDLQRFLQQHPLVLHAFGLIAFFFLFTLLDSSNDTSLGLLVLKNIIVYVLFVLMTKSKWYFVVPVVGLLLVDQVIKKRLNITEAAGNDSVQQQEFQKKINMIINIMIITLIIVGSIHYMILQRIEYKNRFSFYKFFLGLTVCKPVAPKYV